jgi:hypothetical protein
VEPECVGGIVCKLDMHKKMFRRGYIAMLAVDSKYRRKSIGENRGTLCRFHMMTYHIITVNFAIIFVFISVLYQFNSLSANFYMCIPTEVIVCFFRY